MSTIRTYSNFTLALVMGVVLSFVFFTVSTPAAHAEEDVSIAVTSSGSGDIQTALREQIKVLQAKIAEQRAEIEARHEKAKADLLEKKSEYTEKQSEHKSEVAKSREEFLASIEALEGEEKRAAIMEYVEQVKADLAEKRVEFEAKIAEKKEEHEEKKEEYEEMKIEKKEEYEEMKIDHEKSREEFQESIENLVGTEKREAIMDYLAEVKESILQRQKELLDTRAAEEAGS